MVEHSCHLLSSKVRHLGMSSCRVPKGNASRQCMSPVSQYHDHDMLITAAVLLTYGSSRLALAINLFEKPSLHSTPMNVHSFLTKNLTKIMQFTHLGPKTLRPGHQRQDSLTRRAAILTNGRLLAAYWGTNLVAAAKPLFTEGLAKWSDRFSMGPCSKKQHCVKNVLHLGK